MRELSNYHLHAIEELKRCGYEFDDDGYPVEDPNEDWDINAEMCMCILEILDVFERQGHSGTTASYAINVLEKVMRFEPLTPLTGDDDEWNCICDERTDGNTVYQNKRCSHVFKENGQAYDINGKIFWEWYTGEDGERYKSHYTCGDSRVDVEFPYVPKSEEVYRESNCE